ncbi:DnaJ-domain-containing protein [Infundibulicybe gibba]|nr:DnaJ-domain-containing protein [Infundibulicybe gibba]
MNADPASQLFPGEDDINLYAVLSLENSSTSEQIKKAYRKLALVHHPDKHATASEEAKANASIKFQQIGFAYAVLSDEKRKTTYDRTGRTDEGFDFGAGEAGWQTYFEELFDRVTGSRLNEMKLEYQGSSEEIQDLKNAYVSAEGSIETIMTQIPHSTYDDESRFILIISSLINKKELSSLPQWETTIKDEKFKLVRRKRAEKEAKEAEELAKELGVWDEFYGSGKTGARGKGKGLQALMLQRKQKNMDGFFDNLAQKYAKSEPNRRSGGKKRPRNGDTTADEDKPPKKSRKTTSPPPIDDEEFEKLQAKLFGSSSAKSPKVTAEKPKSKKSKSKRS